MKREPMGKRIDRLLSTGLPAREIAAYLGCRAGYVHELKARGGYEQQKIIARARGSGRSREEDIAARRERTRNKHASLIAAVDRGLTYSEAARLFGTTRSAVAGIMHRRAESS